MIFSLMVNFLSNNIAKAQAYQLQSLDGRTVEVKLTDRLGTLAIACDRDTIFLADYWALDTAVVLNGKFLQVSYARRAGSNEGLDYMVLLCVEQNKLVQAMHIKSSSEYDMRNIEHIKGNMNEYQLFRLTAQLLGSDKSSFKLNLFVHDENSSERSPKANYNYDEEITLNFDPRQNIFYSTHVYISKYYDVYNPKTQKEIKKSVNCIVPIVTIGKATYCYIEDQWYERESSNYLNKFTY